ncbi:hypothetical protein [Streptomyces sp. NPDC005525]|uniref:hypothetical protein n=1 Tax=Streptomyces sp. NPDC005525 TaxID=3364720 RepID=UPI00368035F9
MPAAPADFYAGLREHGPVVPVHLDGPVPAWLVIGYDACNWALRDGLVFSRDLGQWSVSRNGLLPPGWPLEPHVTPMPNMLYAQGEEHLRLRGAFTKSLSKIGSNRRQAMISRAADQLIDQFVDDGHADIVGQFAVPLPGAVLAALFGFKAQEAVQLQQAVLTLLSGGDQGLEANEQLTELIAVLVARRRAEPRTDIVTGLLEAGLSDDEARWTIWLSINAGIGATAAWTASSCALLAEQEDARTDLRSGLRHVPGVMAEVLWDHAPVQQVIGRIATQDTDLCGTTVHRGDLLVLSLAGANLDHARFGGSAARRSYTEDNDSHLAWGNGSHGCPAQGLATAIVRGGVERLWTRLDDLHLTHPEQPTDWDDSVIVRIPKRLGVSWSPARAHARLTTLAPIGTH